MNIFLNVPQFEISFRTTFRVITSEIFLFHIIFLHRFVIADLCCAYVWELIARVTLITFEALHTYFSLAT